MPSAINAPSPILGHPAMLSVSRAIHPLPLIEIETENKAATPTSVILAQPDKAKCFNIDAPFPNAFKVLSPTKPLPVKSNVTILFPHPCLIILAIPISVTLAVPKKVFKPILLTVNLPDTFKLINGL